MILKNLILFTVFIYFSNLKIGYTQENPYFERYQSQFPKTASFVGDLQNQFQFSALLTARRNALAETLEFLTAQNLNNLEDVSKSLDPPDAIQELREMGYQNLTQDQIRKVIQKLEEKRTQVRETFRTTYSKYLEYLRPWIEQYGAAIPSEEALDFIRSQSPNGKLIELSNTSYWTEQLTQRGLEVIPHRDYFPVSSQTTPPLFLNLPRYKSWKSISALWTYLGDTIILVGELPRDWSEPKFSKDSFLALCQKKDSSDHQFFFQLLTQNFELTYELDLPFWPWIKSTPKLYLFKKIKPFSLPEPSSFSMSPYASASSVTPFTLFHEDASQGSDSEGSEESSLSSGASEMLLEVGPYVDSTSSQVGGKKNNAESHVPEICRFCSVL